MLKPLALPGMKVPTLAFRMPTSIPTTLATTKVKLLQLRITKVTTNPSQMATKLAGTMVQKRAGKMDTMTISGMIISILLMHQRTVRTTTMATLVPTTIPTVLATMMVVKRAVAATTTAVIMI